AQIEAKHGVPLYTDASQSAIAANMIVVAYGKLGGLELGYSSDLDLVFLHDSRGEAQRTDGPQPIDNTLFFQRVVDRLRSIGALRLATHRWTATDRQHAVLPAPRSAP